MYFVLYKNVFGVSGIKGSQIWVGLAGGHMSTEGSLVAGGTRSLVRGTGLVGGRKTLVPGPWSLMSGPCSVAAGPGSMALVL